DQAWAKLSLAFAALGARMPTENVSSAAMTTAHVTRSRVRRILSRSAAAEAHTELLCELHYQNARLGLEYGRPARLIQSSLESVELSERGGSEAMRARAHAFNALVMTALGRREAGSREVSKARDMAARHGDAATIAFCAELQGIAACWAGDLD